MKKKKNKGKRKKTKKRLIKNIDKKELIKGFFRVVSLLFIFALGAFYFNGLLKTNAKEVSISSKDVEYFIKIADNNSQSKRQLNWIDIASIERVRSKSFANASEDESNLIAQSFYDEEGNLISFEKALNKLNFEAKEKVKIYDIRSRIEGENYKLRTLKYGADENKDQFIDGLKESSIKNYKDYNVLPSIAIGQAILESDWGKSELSSVYNNLYGIKADRSWKGAIAEFSTKENYNDVIRANFRAYSSTGESVEDLGKFLNENSRYRNHGFFQGKNYIEQAQSLENAGYSTIKDEKGELIYADLLISIIRENNLMLIDTEVIK